MDGEPVKRFSMFQENGDDFVFPFLLPSPVGPQSIHLPEDSEASMRHDKTFVSGHLKYPFMMTQAATAAAGRSQEEEWSGVQGDRRHNSATTECCCGWRALANADIVFATVSLSSSSLVPSDLCAATRVVEDCLIGLPVS